MMVRTDVEVGSLIVATDIDTLPDTSLVEDHGAYVVVRSPSNPAHFWGNFVHWRTPPAPGDLQRWEAVFDAAFGMTRESRHLAFSWHGVDDAATAGREQFEQAGYELTVGIGLVATPEQLQPHPRAARDVTMQRLDPGGDEADWLDVIQLQVDNREPGHTEQQFRSFAEQRMSDRRARFARGEGAWLLARTDAGEAAATCGVIVTDGRARFQAVDTLERFRRRGIARRLVHAAGRIAIDDCGASTLVIATEGHNPALALYESLGFVRRERSWEACWWPGAEHAARHPRSTTET